MVAQVVECGNVREFPKHHFGPTMRLNG